MDGKILIAIAAYREPELLPTIRSAMENASRPERIRFAICYQGFTDTECYREMKRMGNVKLVAIPLSESKGCCYARYLTQRMVEDEDYYLQIDGHMRFVKAWDEEMVSSLESLSSRKKLLTAYVPDFGDYELYRERLARGDDSLDYGEQLVAGEVLPNGLRLLAVGKSLDQEPGPAIGYVISGHFLFAPMAFVREVPYDPSLYFWGEEISLSVRAWTHGWDIYNPKYVYCYHLYDRTEGMESLGDGSLRLVHWLEHSSDLFDAMSRYRATDLIQGRIADEWYGLGTERTLEAYCREAQIDLVE